MSYSLISRYPPIILAYIVPYIPPFKEFRLWLISTSKASERCKTAAGSVLEIHKVEEFGSGRLFRLWVWDNGAVLQRALG